MLHTVYVIKDEISNYFPLNLVYSNDKVAKLTIEKLFKEGLLSRQLPLINEHPSEFAVYKSANFDDSNGSFVPLPSLVRLYSFDSFQDSDVTDTIQG